MENTNFNGSVVAARDVVAGADMLVGGDAVIRRNLRVEGWLDAPNLLSPCKGLFVSADALEQSCRHPRTGEWALVGETLPAELYMVCSGKWQSTGRMVGLPIPENSDSTTSSLATDIADALKTAREALQLGNTLQVKVDDASSIASEANNRTHATGIVPFNGILPSRATSKPQRGVWFERPTDEHAGRFVVIESEWDTIESDYNISPGTVDAEARTDRLYRCGNRLYIYYSGGLIPLVPEPYMAASTENVEAEMLADDQPPGRFFCVVDPVTHRVTELYISD